MVQLLNGSEIFRSHASFGSARNLPHIPRYNFVCYNFSVFVPRDAEHVIVFDYLLVDSFSCIQLLGAFRGCYDTSRRIHGLSEV